MSNPRYKKDDTTGKFVTGDNPPMAENPICVRLPVDVDRTLRNMPDRSTFLRELITKAVRKQIKLDFSVGEWG